MQRLTIDAIGLAPEPVPDAVASMDTSGELMARARCGDEEALRQIFEAHARAVINFIFYMVNQRELAEELAQETFLRAYKSLSSLRDEDKLRTWLFGIAKNVAREALRTPDRRVPSVEMDDPSVAEVRDGGPSPAGRLLEKELSSAVRKALMSLDEDKRLVFTLKVYQQLSYEEIVKSTGFSLPKVRNDLHRARAEMRRRLKPYLVGGNEL